MSHPLFRAQTGDTAKLRKAYDAGWKASSRSEDFDLSKAEARYERNHDNREVDAFSAGWTDYASDYPKYKSLPTK